MTYKLRNLNILSPIEIQQIIAAIPEYETELDLSDNFLSLYNFKAMAEALRKLPPSVNTIIWEVNELGRLDIEDLIEIIAAIPHTVTNLSLSTNNLFNSRKMEDAFARFIATLSPKLVGLNLAGNNLYGLKGSGLVRILKLLAQKQIELVGLNLSSNQFSRLTSKELRDFFKITPLSLRFLGLGENNLGLKCRAKLAQIFAAIPPSVKIYDLSSNQFNKKQLELILSLTVVESIILDDRVINATNEVLDKLISLVYRKFYLEHEISFDDIDSFVKVDNRRLNCWIDRLSVKHKPLADLISALLLANEIKTMTDFNENYKYWEKRFHDAISFYMRAGGDFFLKPMVRLLLFKLLLTSKIDSVLQRLELLNLREDCSPDLLSQHGFFKVSDFKINPFEESFEELINLEPTHG